jgi:hypothetical protein
MHNGQARDDVPAAKRGRTSVRRRGRRMSAAIMALQRGIMSAAAGSCYAAPGNGRRDNGDEEE